MLKIENKGVLRRFKYRKGILCWWLSVGGSVKNQAKKSRSRANVVSAFTLDLLLLDLAYAVLTESLLTYTFQRHSQILFGGCGQSPRFNII